MSYREDYLTRMIREFGQTLLGIRDLVRALRYHEALDALDQTTQQLAGLDIDPVANLSLTELLARLTFGDEPFMGRDKCVACAAALNEAGAAYAGLNQPQESSACSLQSLNLMLEVNLRYQHEALADYAPSIDDLLQHLNAYTLPAQTNATLLHYYEQAGIYSKAEDALFAILDVDPANEAAVTLGRTFYERLLRLDDSALRAGNLPRDEVEAGLAELQH